MHRFPARAQTSRHHCNRSESAAVGLLASTLLLSSCGGGGSSEATQSPANASSCPPLDFTAPSPRFADRFCTFHFAAAAAGTSLNVTRLDIITGSEHSGSATATCTRGEWRIVTHSCTFDGPSAADLALQTLVPTPTYQPDSVEHAAFTFLNQQRARCGFGLVAQNTALDHAAIAHADYLKGRLDELGYATFFGTLGTTVHDQIEGKPGFTGVTSSARAQFFGYDFHAGKSYQGKVAEVVAWVPGLATRTPADVGRQAVRSVLASVYQAGQAISGTRDVGIAYSRSQVTSPPGSTLGTVVLNSGWQSHAQHASDVLTYPCQGTSDARPDFAGEAPDPIGRFGLRYPAGAPILVEGPSGKALTVKSASITPTAGGASYTTPASILVLSAGNDPVMQAAGQINRAHLVPHAPLIADTSYRVQLVLNVGGAPVAREFVFSTADGR